MCLQLTLNDGGSVRWKLDTFNSELEVGDEVDPTTFRVYHLKNVETGTTIERCNGKAL